MYTYIYIHLYIYAHRQRHANEYAAWQQRECLCDTVCCTLMQRVVWLITMKKGSGSPCRRCVAVCCSMTQSAGWLIATKGGGGSQCRQNLQPL